MGLDAYVYCNCIQTGKLRTPPDPAWGVYAEYDDGSLSCQTCIKTEQMAFWDWLHSQACEHEDCIYLHHRLGNIAMIRLIRGELQQAPTAFPILLEKVVYNGMHSGDYLLLEDIALLQAELDALKVFCCSDDYTQGFVNKFQQQMQELVDAANLMGHPIMF